MKPFNTNHGETGPIGIDSGPLQKRDQLREDVFPWTAPRVILESLETNMRENEPSVWTIDNYDGTGSPAGSQKKNTDKTVQ